MGAAAAKHAPARVVMGATPKGQAARRAPAPANIRGQGGKSVAAALAKLGGKVAKRVDGVGYVRATVPMSAVRAAAKLPGVAAVDLDEQFRIPAPEPGLTVPNTGAVSTLAATTAPGANTPAV